MANETRGGWPFDGRVPHAQDQLTDVLRLALIPGIGSLTRRNLLERFGSHRGIFAASSGQLRTVRGVGPVLASAIAAAPRTIDVERELELCRQHGIRIVLESSREFPSRLHEIHDPPGLLFQMGRLQAADANAIGIVGTRHASGYGIRQAKRFATGMVEAGYTIVSGLARGIDRAAHEAALAAGGRTIAVVGCGLLNLYPPEHQELAWRITAQGALLSELPPGSRPVRGAFPQRNRLISGLSSGVIVVEAAQRSGALITASHALEQSREVLVVPGPIDSRSSVGCHHLIREGATLVASVADVLAELDPYAQPTNSAEPLQRPAELLLNVQERSILSAIGSETVTIDALVRDSQLPPHRVLATLSVLEMRHLITRESGSRVRRIRSPLDRDL